MLWGLARKLKKKYMLRDDIDILRFCLQWSQHGSFTAFHHAHKPNFHSPAQKGEKARLSTPLSRERFRKKTGPAWRPSCELVLCCLHVFSLQKCPKTLQAGYVGCTGLPRPSLYTADCCLFLESAPAHRCTQETTCLTLASPHNHLEHPVKSTLTRPQDPQTGSGEHTGDAPS